MGSPRRRRDADDGVGAGGRAGVSAVSPLDPSGLSSALGFTSLFNPTWDASCPCCSPSPRAPGRGCRGRLFSRGGRSWRIRLSYKNLCSKFCAREKQPPAVRGRTARGRRCGPCGRGTPRREDGGDVLVEGLACVFHGGEGSGGVGVGARGSCQGGGGPFDSALRTGFERGSGRAGVASAGCGGVAGGCFGNGFIAGLAQFSYKSKNLFAERKQPPLMLAEPPLTIDADYATNDHAGALDGMGTRAVLVAVSDCVFHGGRVTGESALGARGSCQGGGLRPPRPSGYRLSPVKTMGVWGNYERRGSRRAAPRFGDSRFRRYDDGGVRE